MIDTLSIAQLDSLNKNIKLTNIQLHEIKTEISVGNEDEKFLNKITYDTVFTVIITIGIFALGVLIDRIIKICEHKRKEQQLRNYFIFHLQEIEKSYLPPLIEGYKKFYEQHNVDTGIPLSPPRLLSGDIERICTIDNSELFHSFKNKKKLSKILSQVDLLSKFSSETESYHSIVLGYSNEKRKVLNDLISLYMETLASLVERELPSNPKNPYVNFINDKIIYYYENFVSKRELSKFYAEIVRPIQEYIVENNLHKNHDTIRSIASLGKQLSHKYNDLKDLSVEISSQYKQFHEILVEVQNNIKPQIDLE
jgi:hypothetical protein